MRIPNNIYVFVKNSKRFKSVGLRKLFFQLQNLGLKRSMSDRFGFTFKKALLSALRGLSTVIVMNGMPA